MTLVKTLEQRIIERAQNDLRRRVSDMVEQLRSQLNSKERDMITHLVTIKGIDKEFATLGQLLDVVEELAYKACEDRFVDKVLDSTLTALEADLAYRAGLPQQGIPPVPAATFKP